MAGALQLASPLGLLCFMIIGMGLLRQVLRNAQRVDLTTGFLFGAVAVLAMHNPIEPYDGFIIDLRNVPVVLAGAFLGVRGLLACAGLAILARMSLGGVGMMSGVLSIVIAAYVGAIWRKMTVSRRPRSWWHMMALGAGTWLTFAAILFLPKSMALWFTIYAMAPLGLAYITIIPLGALMLEREQRRVDAYKQLRSELQICPDTGLLRPASFLRETVSFASREPDGALCGLLVIRPICPIWLKMAWGDEAIRQVQKTVSLYLSGQLALGARAGLSPRGSVLVPITQSDVQVAPYVVDMLSQRLFKRDMASDTGAALTLDLDIRMIPASTSADMQRAIIGADHVEAPPPRATEGEVIYAPQASIVGATESDQLFRKFEERLSARKTLTGRLRA